MYNQGGHRSIALTAKAINLLLILIASMLKSRYKQRMKFLHRFMIALCLLLCPFMVLAEKPIAYLSSMPDVPVMEGLTEGLGSTLSFDKPEGRILSVFTIAEKELEPSRIFEFYETTLPQLGWTLKNQGHFTRDNEQLLITVETEDDGQVVQFLLTPQAK